MQEATIQLTPLTEESFSPFGDVLEAAPHRRQESINGGDTLKFLDQSRVVARGGDGVAISIFRAQRSSALPFRVEVLERHPNGSQAFMPLDRRPFVVIVGEVEDATRVKSIKAFLSNGNQGINLRPGTWHHHLITFHEGQEFLVVDRVGSDNLDTLRLEQSALVVT